MQATGCGDRCPATGADGVTARAISVALASGNTVTRAAALTAAITLTAAVALTIARSVSSGSPATSTSCTAATAPSATALGECRTYGQGNNSESEHEHTDPRHVACLLWIVDRATRVGCRVADSASRDGNF